MALRIVKREAFKTFVAVENFHGATNRLGLESQDYEKNQIYEVEEELADLFIRNKLGREVPEERPASVEKPSTKRGRRIGW